MRRLSRSIPLTASVVLTGPRLNAPMPGGTSDGFPRMSERIAVIGLGYVGLPVALGFAEKFPGTIGFDIDVARVEALARGDDWTGETSREELKGVQLTFTHREEDLKGAD